MVGDGFGGRHWYQPTNYAVGSYSAYSICDDSNQLYSWGTNSHSQLGNINAGLGSATPLRGTNMSNVFYYSVGYMGGAIKGDLSGWVWGKGYGNAPRKMIDSVVFLDAGASVLAFIKQDGTVWSVGVNEYGSFGNGEFSYSVSADPVKMDSISNAVRVSNSGNSTSILTNDGKVFISGFWGPNKTEEVLRPRLINDLADIVDIKATKNIHVALSSTGKVYSWGIGYNNTIVNVGMVNGLDNIVAISACNDGDHVLALDSLGRCYGWGDNDHGQLGGSIASISVTYPTLVAENVIDILAGETFSYIVKDDLELYATGETEVSLWMDLPSIQRREFTKIDPSHPSMNLCLPKLRKLRLASDTICSGDTLFIQDSTYTKSGNYSNTYQTQDGSDIMVVTQVFVVESSSFDTSATLCNGDIFTLNSKEYSESGTFLDTLTNGNGCDSLITLTLIFHEPTYFDTSITFCFKETYILSGTTLDTSGTYYDTLQNANGCDSIQTFNLTFLNESRDSQYLEICFGDSFIYNGKTHYESALFIDTFINSNGCDSTMNTWLTVLDENTTYQNRIICIGDSVVVGQNEYFYFGTFYDTLATQNGCDSFIVTRIDTFTDFTCYDATVFVPNTFTPNSNNLNEVFRPIGINIADVQMKIFNRWGEKLYEDDGKEIAWDGNYLSEPCQQGVYLYLIIVTSSSGKTTPLNGTVHLLR